MTKDDKRAYLGFTFAETLIALLVIAVLAFATVPLVKKSKLIMDDGQVKNSWAAVWEDDTLVVYENGQRHTSGDKYFFDSTTAKFTPPAGAENFNVTVIGGGGGGAAGSALPGFAKFYFADSNGGDYTFRAPFDGIYRIVAIGGGGGGGGGGVGCSGEDGRSGGGVLALAELEKGDELAVIVGVGGTRGKGQSVWDAVKSVAAPVLSIAAVVAVAYFAPSVFPAIAKSLGMTTLASSTSTALISQGYGFAFASIAEVGCIGSTLSATTSALLVSGAGVAGAKIASGAALTAIANELLTPSNEPKKGGGHALSTVVYGINKDNKEIVNISAGGGSGGRHKRKKFTPWPKCKYAGMGDMEKDFPTIVSGTALKSKSSISSNRKSRFFCFDKDTGGYPSGRVAFCSTLKNNITGGITEATTFGNGGRHGGGPNNGERGSDGYAEITEVISYGGGGGQAGFVSSHVFNKLPPVDVQVIVGKGGKGGVAANSTTSGLTEAQQSGQDGTFSSFGSKILASGGEGGQLRTVAAKQSADYMEYTSTGENGFPAAVTNKLLSQAGLTSGRVSEYKGVAKNNGQGAQDQKGYPGLGGAGGGAYTNVNTSVYNAYLGGDGASGAVIITWK